MADVTSIDRRTDRVDPALLRKVEAVIADVQARLPAGWTLAIFETARSPARAAWLKANGYSWTTRSKHVPDAKGVVRGVDIVFRDPKGRWTWEAPRFVDARLGR
jgi:hypothetical protein